MSWIIISLDSGTEDNVILVSEMRGNVANVLNIGVGLMFNIGGGSAPYLTPYYAYGMHVCVCMCVCACVCVSVHVCSRYTNKASAKSVALLSAQ